MKGKAWFFIVLLLTVSLTTAACSLSQQTKSTGKGWAPESTVEIVAPAAPGGGWDTMARQMQKALTDEKIVHKSVIVSNKPGGGGATGWTYLKGKEGNGHFVAANSSLILLNNLLGSSNLTYKDFTPLAMLTTEWISIQVKGDSPYKTGREVLDALKKDPGSLTIGVGPSLGNNDHLSFVRVAKAYGIDVSKLKWVVFEGAGGDIIMALLGGHIDVGTMSVSECLPQHKAGKLRILSTTADKRIDVLPDVPTWKEQGIDVVFPHWRGIMGPPNMTPEQIKFWDDALAKMCQSDTFKKAVTNANGYVYYKNSAEFRKFLDEQNAIMGPLVDQLGLKKK